MRDDEFVVIYVDRMHGNAYYDRYRNNWIMCAVEHEEGRALHLDKKSGALVCYGYGHENNYIRGRRYKIVEIDVDEWWYNTKEYRSLWIGKQARLDCQFCAK
jgi:hypothetical protein